MFSLIFLVACAAYVLLDLRLLTGLRNLARLDDPDGNPGYPFVTVLIAARNEETSLPRVLDALLAQDYPRDRLQIVVANDRSADGTGAVLRDYFARHPGRIEFVEVDAVEPGTSPKKNALRLGLARARGEWIAVTDADCTMGPGWLEAMSRLFRADTGMVLGLTAYAEPADGFRTAEGVRALEFVSYGVTAAALVGLGFPVIANANNLAYRRRAFDDAGGYDRHANIVSGDDDFALQEIHATGKWKTRYCPAPSAMVRTHAPATWAMFWEQRKRWASKCMLYRPRQALFLGAIFLFYAVIALLLVAGPWNAQAWILGLVGLGTKTAADYAVMRGGLRLFGLGRLLRHFPGTALLHIPLILAAVVAGGLTGFTWKGQKLSRKAR